MVSTTAGRALAAANINDNTGGDITPADVRAVFTAAFDVVEKADSPVASVLDHDATAGNGATNAVTAITAAAATGRCRLPPGVYRISSNITVSVPIHFYPGASLSIDSGITVTLTDRMTAPFAQIFSGAGTVTGLSRDVRPEWWGALRNGTTDDSAAINKAAVCVGTTGGGTVILSAGNYAVQNSIVIAHDNVAFRGAGQRTTRLLNPTTTVSTFQVNTGRVHWIISDLSILHTLTTVSGSVKTTAGAGINAPEGSYGLIERVDIHGACFGIVLGNSVGTHVAKFEIDQFAAAGILINGNANDMFIRDGIIAGGFNGVADTTNIGIHLRNKAEAIFVSNLEIIQCDLALKTDVDVAGIAPAFSFFESCFFDSCTSGVLLYRCLSVRFTDCWFSNRPNHGCVVRECTDTSFVNCSFINSHQHGCVVEASAKHTKFNGCTFSDNGQAAAGTWDGLAINAGTTDFSVTGCSMMNTARFGNTQRNGVRVGAGASDRYIIADNLVTGNTSTGVVDSGSGTNKRVANNY